MKGKKDGVITGEEAIDELKRMADELGRYFDENPGTKINLLFDYISRSFYFGVPASKHLWLEPNCVIEGTDSRLAIVLAPIRVVWETKSFPVEKRYTPHQFKRGNGISGMFAVRQSTDWRSFQNSIAT